MNDIENKAGLFLAAIVIFIFLVVVAFVKRNSRAKTDNGKKENIDTDSDYKK